MSGILTFIESVLRFFLFGIRSTLSLVVQLPGLITSVSSTFAYMPEFILPYVRLSLIVIVLMGLIKLIP